ncbi:Centrosomal protein of 78 kDa, partial [Cladochytrium tenue]
MLNERRRRWENMEAALTAAPYDFVEPTFADIRLPIPKAHRPGSRPACPRGRDASPTFAQAYARACELRQVPILPHIVSPALDALGHLLVDCDRIKREDDWDPVIRAVRANRDLRRIHFVSDLGPVDEDEGIGERADARSRTLSSRQPRTGAREKALRRPAVNRITRISIFLASVLELAGLRLSEKALGILSTGLYCNRSIQVLSLARCYIGDSGLRVISRGIKAAKHLTELNLAQCSLTAKGAMIITELLRSQAVQRQAANWERTLRHHGEPPVLRAPAQQVQRPGLSAPIRRLNLCHNRIGDAGVLELFEALREEIGLAAVDLQDCGVTGVGARLVQQVLNENKELMVVDFRGNQLDPILVKVIYNMLYANVVAKLIALEDSGENAGVPDLPEWLPEGDPLQGTYFESLSRSEWPDGLARHTESSINKRRFPLRRAGRATPAPTADRAVKTSGATESTFKKGEDERTGPGSFQGFLGGTGDCLSGSGSRGDSDAARFEVATAMSANQDETPEMQDDDSQDWAPSEITELDIRVVELR